MKAICFECYIIHLNIIFFLLIYQKFLIFLDQAISENEKDAEALKALQKVEYSVFDKIIGRENDFALKFYFGENEFFTNDVLTVTLFLKEPREPTKIEGTEINWKENQCLTKKTVTKKQKNKKTGAQRTVTKTEDCPSFFNIFSSNTMPDGDEEDFEEEEAQQQEAIYTQCDNSYAFFDELIPFSMEYFLGVKKDDYGEDYDDLDDEDDDFDDDDDEDEKPKGKLI